MLGHLTQRVSVLLDPLVYHSQGGWLHAYEHMHQGVNSDNLS